MTCEQALDYVYGELDDAQKRAFEEHLPTCARCQAEVASFGRVRTATKRLMAPTEPTAQLTGALHAQLMHAAAQRKPKRGVLLSFPRRIVEHPALSAAAMFVIVGGAIAINWSRGKLAMPAAESTAAPKQTEAPKPIDVAPAAKTAPEPTPAAAEPAPLAKDKEQAKQGATTIALQTPQGALTVKRAAAPRGVAPAKMKTVAVRGKRDGLDDLLSEKAVARDESEGGVGAYGGLAGGGAATGAKSSAPAQLAHAYKNEEPANKPMPSRYAAPVPTSPAAQPTPPPPAAASAAAPSSNIMQRGAAVQKPASAGRSYDVVRKQADEFASANRCDEAIKLYQELEKSNQYLSPTERVSWVRCLTQKGRQQEAQQRLDELKAEKRVTNAQIQDAERELDDARRRLEPKKKAAKKAPAASDRAVQTESQQRPAEAPAQATPPDSTHTKVDSKTSF